MKRNLLAPTCFLLFLTPLANAAVYSVTNNNDSGAGSLRQAITDLNSGGTAGSSIGNNTISVSVPGASTITLASDLPVIQNGVAITSSNPNQGISGAGAYRIFATYEASLLLTDLDLNDGRAIGGNGGIGAGGGMGAGGGVYISPGQALVLNDTTINSCRAQGGNGGGTGAQLSTGGGGGASFTIGSTKDGYSAGSGQGIGGGDNPGNITSGGAAVTLSSSSGDGGGNGGNGIGSGGAGGGDGAGANRSGLNGGAGGYCGGGGAGSSRRFSTDIDGGGGGGNGGGSGATYGGGGGSYGSGGGVRPINISGVLLDGPGGGGGFGGGGGGCAYDSVANNGSGGSIGGGGNGASRSSTFAVGSGGGGGGYGGGGGGSYTFGGYGGAGIGGAVFVGDSSSIVVNDGVTMSGNTVAGGSGSGGSGAPDIFLFRQASVSFQGSENLSVAYSIQCDTGAVGGNLDLGVTINKDSVNDIVTFSSSSNNYQGSTTITRGTLQATGDNLPTSTAISIAANGKFTLNSGGAALTGVVTNNGQCDVSGTLNPAATSANTNDFNILSGGSVTLGSSFANSGTIENAGGLVISTALTGAGTVTNQSSGSLEFGSSATNANAVQNDGVFAVNNAFVNNAVITNNATMNVSAAITGSGSVSNAGTGTVTLNSGGSITQDFTNAGLLNIASGGTLSAATFSNSGTIQVSGGFSISTALTGAGSVVNNSGGNLTFGAGSTNANAIQNDSTFTIANAFSNSAVITNNATMNINAALSGAGSIVNSATGTVAFGAGGSSANSIQNNGILQVQNDAAVTAVITNNAIMNVSAALTGTGALTSNAASTLNLNTGANIAKAVTNSGRTNFNGNATLTSFNSTGLVVPSGQRTVTTTNFTNSGTQTHTITNASSFDSLNVSGAVDLSDCAITVNSSFAGNSGTPWTLISGSSLTTNGSTTVTLPSSSTFITSWSSEFTSTSLIVSLVTNSLEDLAINSINKKVAVVIDGMSNNITNNGQQELVNIISSVSSQEELNDALHKLIPNQNYAQQSIQLQNAVFSRAESRIAKLNSNMLSDSRIYAAGDIYADTALWIGGFGASTRQQQRCDNQGYKASAAGFLFGIDHINWADNIFGIALGASNSSVNDQSNPNFNTKIIGYHLLAYGTCNLEKNNFSEFLLTSSINDNTGTRPINISNNDLTNTASYHNYQIGARINYGKHCDVSPSFTLSPVAMVQYGFLHNPVYQETGGVAALEVEQNGGKNILTIGAGMRLSFSSDNWWSMGSREIRAMVTYDAVSPSQNIASRFLVGSDDFILSSSSARLAFKAGVDLGFQMLSSVVLQLSYDYEVRQGFVDHSGMLKFKYLF